LGAVAGLRRLPGGAGGGGAGGAGAGGDGQRWFAHDTHRSRARRAALLARLPAGVRPAAGAAGFGFGVHPFQERRACAAAVRGAVGAAVARGARVQTLKGIVTAGASKSVRYGAAKLRKTAQGLRFVRAIGL